VKTTRGYAQHHADERPHRFDLEKTMLSDRHARILWESDFRAMQRIVRNAADMPCKCVAVNLNNCLSCQARKVMKK